MLSVILKEYEKKTLEELNKELSSSEECRQEENTKSKIGNEDLNKITAYLEKNSLSSVLKIASNSIKARSWVGIVKYKNIQIQILPKLISEDDSQILKNLLYMLSYTKKLNIKTSDSAKLSQTTNPFLEVLIREYANSMFECLKRLTPKDYIREEDNLNYLKGKLKFTENIRYNCANKAKFYCEYDEFSENNILNQLFLFVSTCLYSISKDSKNKTLLKFIMDYFCDIKLVRFNSSQCNKIHLKRTQQMFEKSFKLAKMFVENSSVDLSNNRIENITLLWDMNKLFEEFVYETIRRKKKEFENVTKVEAQKVKKLLVKDKSKKRDTKIDILITKKDEAKEYETKIILDTKYKKFEKFDDISSSDIYQVMTYCLLYDKNNNQSENDSQENNSKDNNSAILLYPVYKKGSQPDEFGYKLNSVCRNYRLDLRTLDLMHSDLEKSQSEIIDRLKDIIKQGRINTPV